MSIGTLVRVVAGPRAFRILGDWYRSIFVDLNQVVEILAALTPAGAEVLDVGGGDGAPVNGLVAKREDLSITMIDTGHSVGAWIEERFLTRVARLPKTSLVDYLGTNPRVPDVILLLDVIHHIPVLRRPSFFAELGALFVQKPSLRLIVKDVEPGHWRATLGLWSDRYVTGDRNVEFISRAQLVKDLQSGIGAIQCRETQLFERDSPNYMFEIERPHPDRDHSRSG